MKSARNSDAFFTFAYVTALLFSCLVLTLFAGSLSAACHGRDCTPPKVTQLIGHQGSNLAVEVISLVADEADETHRATSVRLGRRVVERGSDEVEVASALVAPTGLADVGDE